MSDAQLREVIDTQLREKSDMELIKMYNKYDIHPTYAELFQKDRIDVDPSVSQMRDDKLNSMFDNLSLNPSYAEEFQKNRIDKSRSLTEMLSELSLQPNSRQIEEEKALYNWLIQTYGKQTVEQIFNAELKQRQALLHSLQHGVDNGMHGSGGGQQGHRNRSGSRRKRTAHRKRKNCRKSKRVHYNRRKHTRRHRHSRHHK